MKAVSNTTPLRYLIAIEQEHLLGQLFEKVFVPVAVRGELTDAKTPETVRRRVLALPAWFEVRTAQETEKTTFPVTLHRGEREAILLAEALHADVLLIDEQVGRTIALSRNLPLSGKESKMLAYLIKNPRRVISREELLNEVWRYENHPRTRTVDNHILKLRKKLEAEPAHPQHFHTVHSAGYKFLP
jgi:predicted nucleic acid-binding protein